MNEDLLEGIYDLHVHTAPDISNRKLDDLDYAKIATKYKMKGFGIKSHYFNSSERARLVKKIYPDLDVIGAVTLNYSVGGVNPNAVEMAAKSGAKLVWLPTFDAENERKFMLEQSYGVLPPWAQVKQDSNKQDENIGLTIIKDGQLTNEIKEVVQICKERELILNTGHVSKKEIVTLAKYTQSEGYNKLVVTHPTFSSIALSLEEQLELLEYGVTLEQCYGVIAEHYGITWEKMLKIMKATGDKGTIISSDLGQIENPYPHEGLLDFINKLINAGFSLDFIKNVTTNNQVRLLGG